MEKIFDVKAMTNRGGHKHLLVITKEAVEDLEIGGVVIVPYADGYTAPLKVRLLCDENGLPKLANGIFAIVSEYIYTP